VAAWPRGDLVEGAHRYRIADLPDDPRQGHRRAGAGRWLDSNTFVFNDSVVANEEGLAQIKFILDGLGIELVTTHSPGWVESTGNGNIGTTHADMFVMTPDIGLAVLAPHLVDYGFVRYLNRRGIKIIEVPVEEYWDLAVNAVTLEPGRIVMNAGSPTVVRALEKGRRRGPPGRLLRKSQVRDRGASLRDARACPRPARPAARLTGDLGQRPFSVRWTRNRAPGLLRTHRRQQYR
jgi:hypothetical protein